jgi:hypothetical protein
MKISSTVLDPQEVPGLGNMTEEGVIGLGEPFVGIVAASRIFDLVACRENRTIEVERDTFEFQSPECAQDERPVQAQKCIERGRGETLQPPTQSPFRCKALDPDDPFDQPVRAEIPNMAKAIAARKPERHERQNQFVGLVITRDARPAECFTDQIAQTDRPKVAIEKLKSGETRQFLIRELNLKISVDSPVNFAIF